MTRTQDRNDAVDRALNDAKSKGTITGWIYAADSPARIIYGHNRTRALATLAEAEAYCDALASAWLAWVHLVDKQCDYAASERHIAVDTADGYLFGRGSDGQPFTPETARAFADQRNADCKPDRQTYAVYRLALVQPAPTPGNASHVFREVARPDQPHPSVAHYAGLTGRAGAVPAHATLGDRRALCEVPGVTLGGLPAVISGARNDHATVANLSGVGQCDFSWPTVARVVASGGAFMP